jgi:hypothetical protein
MNSHEDFPLKSCVKKLEFKRGRKEERPKYIEANWLLSPLYSALYITYKSVFFYFLPFAASLYPLIRSLKGNIKL